MQRNVLLLDRDGVLTVEKPRYTPEDIALFPGVIEGLARLRGFRLFVVSNQSAVGRGVSTLEEVEGCNERLRELLAAGGITLEDIVFCPHAPEGGCSCRKPRTGMWETLRERHGLDPARCIMVGNRQSDLEFGSAIGCLTVLVSSPWEDEVTLVPDLRVRNLVELAQHLGQDGGESPRGRVMTIGEAAEFALNARRLGKRIVTTNGAFDLLHDGHLFLFREAAKHGDVLIIGVNSDASVRKAKGPGRPVESQQVRAENVSAYADAVFVFDDPDPREWLRLIRPDVHANAATYGEDCVEASVLREIGSVLVLIPVRPELGSTTGRIGKRN